MKVIRETVTVLTDPTAGEVSLILSGWRITLGAEEAELLARGLATGLERLRAAPRPKSAGPPEPPAAARNTSANADRAGGEAIQHIVAPLTPDPEAIQQRARALIQASIRDKGPARDESSG